MKKVTEIKKSPYLELTQFHRKIKRVAVYARISTDKDAQLTSIDVQKRHYQKVINDKAEWILAGVYADEGISGLSSKHRPEFTRMLEDCESGKIDMILTKSVSRFARNTLDSLKVLRKLKELGIGVMFEKENIWTLDSKGEFILTLMASFAQEESRSISENVAWGKRKLFQDGKFALPYSGFLGYDKGENGELVVNDKEAFVIRRIYRQVLQGLSSGSIARLLTADGIATPRGLTKWSNSVVKSILTNEKYKGDALLQKSFTVDFLTKKKKKNEGELPKYYIKNNHEPIIDPWLFDYVQEILKIRTDENNRMSYVDLLSNKIKCGKCGRMFSRYTWHSTSYNDKVWQCRSKMKRNGYCKNIHIYDDILQRSILIASFRLLRKYMCVVDDCIEVLPNGPLPNLAEYKAFLFLDLENLSFIIERIIANADNSLTFQFLDGSSHNVDLQSRSLSKKQAKKKQVESHTKECKSTSHENAIYTYVCAVCGKQFEAYGNNHRKYCSHKCYINDRFYSRKVR